MFFLYLVFTGMDTIDTVKIQNLEEKLPAVTSGSLFQNPSVHKRKIDDEKDAFGSSEDDFSLSEHGGGRIPFLYGC